MSDQPPIKKPQGDYDAPRGETLDVVMLKTGVSAHDAKPEDFRRVTVQAEGTWAAKNAPEVEAAEKEGWTTLQAVKPGFLNEHEQAARRRTEAPLTDRTKI